MAEKPVEKETSEQVNTDGPATRPQPKGNPPFVSALEKASKAGEAFRSINRGKW